MTLPAPFNVPYPPYFLDLEFCNVLSGAILSVLYPTPVGPHPTH